MKPSRFDYHPADTIDAALQLAAAHGEDGKILAGGQSLIPAMNFRLARPDHVIDLNPVKELAYIDVRDTECRIGAMTRQRAVERSGEIAAGWPLLAQAVAHIGHVQIRTRGTVGGSLAHSDPAAELPAVAVALGATMVVRSASAERVLAASDFFVSYMTTALEPTEILTEIRFPRAAERTGYSFLEISRRPGDFALVGLAASVAVERDGRIRAATLVFTGVGPTPHRVDVAQVAGARGSAELFDAAAAEVARGLEPGSDIHADADHRRDLAAEIARRGLRQAHERASAGPKGAAS